MADLPLCSQHRMGKERRTQSMRFCRFKTYRSYHTSRVGRMVMQLIANQQTDLKSVTGFDSLTLGQYVSLVLAAARRSPKPVGLVQIQGGMPNMELSSIGQDIWFSSRQAGFDSPQLFQVLGCVQQTFIHLTSNQNRKKSNLLFLTIQVLFSNLIKSFCKKDGPGSNPGHSLVSGVGVVVAHKMRTCFI